MASNGGARDRFESATDGAFEWFVWISGIYR
jgi:hypothetical protein